MAPALVPYASIFARTCGPQNAALITGEHAGDIGVFGAGAGGAATAVAAIGDLLTIARDRAAIVRAPVLKEPSLITGVSDARDARRVDRGTDVVDLLGRPDGLVGALAEAV